METDPAETYTNDELSATTRGWAWLQRPWWFVRGYVHALGPARFSLFVALVVGALFLFNQQGTEIFRSLAERERDGWALNTGQIAWFFGALLVWSLQTWYWARLLLGFEFGDATVPPTYRQGRLITLSREHAPRVLGVLPPVTIAIACFFLAPQGYDDATRAGHGTILVLRLFGVGAMVMAAGLYGGFLLRRKWLLARSRGTAADAQLSQPRYRHLSEFLADGNTRWVVLTSIVLSGVLVLNFLFYPVESGLAIGSGAILCLAAAAWVCFGSLIVWLSDRLRLPLIGFLVAWVLFCSLWNDNHLIRLVPPETAAPNATPGAAMTVHKRWAQTPPDAPVATAFAQWATTLPPDVAAAPPGGPKPLRPVFIVATEGGGIRAAYWTALVLGALQDESWDNIRAWQSKHPGQGTPPDFASGLFAISGVSGGSLGAAVFDALLADDATYPLADKAGNMLRQDYLSPTLAAMLFPDFLQRFWPWPVAAADRARALEHGWENGWRRTISGNAPNRFSEPFLSLWTRSSATAVAGFKHLPALFLNGTSVETGKRIIVSNLAITGGPGGEFSDAEDAASAINPTPSTHQDVPLSTAAHMSARFTYVSPAGRLPSGGHVVDGGYFENSAATTALEILYVMEGVIDAHDEWPDRLVPVVIEIRNAPTSELVAPAAGQPPPPSVLYKHHELLGEVMDPLTTMLNTRDARGSFAQGAIESEQENIKGAPPWTLFRFGLHESAVPLPLGWMLAGGAAREMQEQLHKKDQANQKTLDAITQTLLPPD